MNQFHTETRISKYKETQRRIQSMEKQLADLDNQKYLLEAQIADEALYAAALAPEATEKDVKAYERRQARRAKEIDMRLIVPPGLWDDDLDAHLEERVTWTKDGFQCSIVRNLDRTWQGFVTPSSPSMLELNTNGFGRATVSVHDNSFKLCYDQCWDTTPVPIASMTLLKKSFWTHYTTYEESRDHVEAFVRWIQAQKQERERRNSDKAESIESEEDEEYCEFHAWMGHYCPGQCYRGVNSVN